MNYEAVRILEGLDLQKVVMNLRAAGHTPKMANAKAIGFFDVADSPRKGFMQLAILEDGLETWIEQLEDFAESADSAAAALAQLR